MMRPLYAIGMVLAGCATDPTFEPASVDPPAPTSGTVTASPNETPRMCAVHVWSSIAAKQAGARLAVASLPDGAALFSIPPTGGPLSGFAIDGAGEQLGSPAGTQLAPGPFTTVRAGYFDDRIIAAASDGTNTHLDFVRDDFGDAVEVAKLHGEWIGEQPVTQMRAIPTALSAGPGGIFETKFDAQWAPADPSLALETVVGGFTGQPYGNQETMVAWTTADACYVERVAIGALSSRPLACRDPHLATDIASNGAKLMFERDGDVYMSDIESVSHDMLSDEHYIARDAHAPRIVFDGAHYWASYLDSRSDVVFGRIDGAGQLWTRAIAGLRPGGESYQLALVDGRPWLFAVLEQAFVGIELCDP
jgi:hypothetical protein